VNGPIYIDSSSLLKLLWNEPESAAVREAVGREHSVVVAALTELEVAVQLRAKRLAGAIPKRRYDAYVAQLLSFKAMAPFEFLEVPGTVFRLAVEQHQGAAVHCRSLDRLHLACMHELGVRRLMTNDGKQAAAAHAMKLQVVSPGS
jgi:predicted nucleic acid-binding protein